MKKILLTLISLSVMLAAVFSAAGVLNAYAAPEDEQTYHCDFSVIQPTSNGTPLFTVKTFNKSGEEKYNATLLLFFSPRSVQIWDNGQTLHTNLHGIGSGRADFSKDETGLKIVVSDTKIAVIPDSTGEEIVLTNNEGYTFDVSPLDDNLELIAADTIVSDVNSTAESASETTSEVTTESTTEPTTESTTEPTSSSSDENVNSEDEVTVTTGDKADSKYYVMMAVICVESLIIVVLLVLFVKKNRDNTPKIQEIPPKHSFKEEAMVKSTVTPYDNQPSGSKQRPQTVQRGHALSNVNNKNRNIHTTLPDEAPIHNNQQVTFNTQNSDTFEDVLPGADKDNSYMPAESFMPVTPVLSYIEGILPDILDAYRSGMRLRFRHLFVYIDEAASALAGHKVLKINDNENTPFVMFENDDNPSELFLIPNPIYYNDTENEFSLNDSFFGECIGVSGSESAPISGVEPSIAVMDKYKTDAYEIKERGVVIRK